VLLTSLFFAVIGGYLLVSSLVFFKFGIPVEVKVQKQSLNLSKNSTFSPIFEIISGEHAGVVKKSKIGTSFGTHQKGTVLRAQYLRSLGLIESQMSLKITGFAGGLVLLGVIGFNIFTRVF
jgi:hypothetical protein